MAKNSKTDSAIAVMSDEARAALALPIRAGRNMADLLSVLATNTDIADAISAGLEIEQRVKLEEGDMIRGTYRGRTETSYTNLETGEVSAGWLHNFSVANGVIAQVGGGYDLDKKLENYPIDADVFVMRGPQTDTRRGKRVNTWFVGKARGGAASHSTVEGGVIVNS